jgi:translation elongation factor EF-G
VSSLRSLTKGRASYSMEIESYEQVPAAIEKELAAKFNNPEDDD